MRAILSLFAANGGPRIKNWIPRFLRLAPAFIMIVLACAPGAALAQATASAPSVQSSGIDSEVFRIKAQSLFDLAVLYLNNGSVDKAVAAARQILQPPIPSEYEEAVVESMSRIAGKLKDAHRFDLAQALLDDTFKVIVQTTSRVKILQVKAALYHLAGEDDKAIEAWKRAKDLEGRRLY
jgi:tetratricopeptide (TPR) repeat protein